VTLPKDYCINTDPDFISIILENLLLNAMEAGGAGTRVTIRLDAGSNGQQCQIECLDDGPGISPDLLPDRLFEPFTTAKQSGSGIGLWQARRLMESLGGEISFRNNEDGGACFLLVFS